MSLIETANAIKTIRISNARKDLSSFTTYTTKGYQLTWFHKYICDRLTLAASQKDQRIIVKMPPRRGKTEIVSRNYPAFLFGLYPETNVMCCTHTDSLSKKINRSVQRKMDSPAYREIFPDTKLSEGGGEIVSSKAIRNSNEFEIVEYGGIYRNAGIGNAIAGEGFDTGIIDDFLPDTEAAESITTRESQKEWYSGDFYTRRAPGANIIILATQRHEDDLIGWLINLSKSDPNADQWEVISFPNECDYEAANIPKPAYDIRQEGELLWAERFDMADALATRALLGTYLYSAIYQQRPTAREGNVFKRAWYLNNGKPWSIPSLNGQMKSVAGYWDLAYSDNPNADQTAGALILTDKSHSEWVQEVKAGRWSIGERNKSVLAASLKWNALFPGMNIYLESGMGAGVSDVQELQRLLIANGINAQIDNVRLSKVVRATSSNETGSFLAASEAGMIHFCDGEWVEPALLELSRLIYRNTASGMEFTGGHDDILDALVGCHRKLTIPVEEFNITIIDDIEGENEWA